MLGAQCAFRVNELWTGEPAPTNVHDDTWTDAARDSLARIRRLGSLIAELSHDRARLRL